MLTKNLEKRELRLALLEAGRAILATEGLAGLALRAVTRRAGVSPTAAYRYFADREHMLAAIATSGVWELTADLETADRSAAKPLVAQGVAYFRFATANPALYRLIFGPERLGNYPELENALAAAYGVLAARVAKHAAPGEAADKSFACWCLMHGLASLAIDSRLPPDAGAAEELAARLSGVIVPGTL
jgi:AcrR family transcriptional regulator